MLADETLSLDSGVEVLPPLKKLLESAGSQEKAAHLSEITDDFLHMDKLQFLPPCKVCRGAATGFHYGKKSMVGSTSNTFAPSIFIGLFSGLTGLRLRCVSSIISFQPIRAITQLHC